MEKVTRIVTSKLLYDGNGMRLEGLLEIPCVKKCSNTTNLYSNHDCQYLYDDVTVCQRLSRSFVQTNTSPRKAEKR